MIISIRVSTAASEGESSLPETFNTTPTIVSTIITAESLKRKSDNISNNVDISVPQQFGGTHSGTAPDDDSCMISV